MSARRARARAKLNLSLRVLAREDSGYHQIETLFCALELADDVLIEPAAGGVSLDVLPDGALPADDLGPPERNLAVRAATLFVRAARIRDGLRIRLTKRIPAGAGLGGGSSDAAAVLRTLRDAHPGAITEQALLALGAELGSDVPFFLTNAPLALAWGRGGRLLPLDPLPVMHVVLAIPPERVPTAEAYGALPPRIDPGASVLAAPADWADVAAMACNDFEGPVFARFPRLAAIRAELEERGARVARMTGSGSVVFGVFESGKDAVASADAVRARHPDVGTLLTRTTGGEQAE